MRYIGLKLSKTEKSVAFYISLFSAGCSCIRFVRCLSCSFIGRCRMSYAFQQRQHRRQ
jgi:hypothetical protein